LYDEAIAANKEYCAVLIKFLEELNERKSLLEKRYRLLKEEIWRLKTNAGEKTRKRDVTKRLSFSNFGYPYFKDKDGKPLPGNIKLSVFLPIDFKSIFLFSIRRSSTFEQNSSF
jgi:hypothetical protein